MYAKYVGNGNRPLCGSTVINLRPTYITNEAKLKKLVDMGYKIEIKDGKQWVKGREYYVDPKQEEQKVVETNEIEVVEENDEDDSPDYEELFEGHWTHQVQNVKEFTNNPEVVESVLEYAIENDLTTEGVLDRVKDYLDELE